MARDPEYSQYTLHVCSHMRLVVWGEGSSRVDRGLSPSPTGWFHVDKSGMLENFCQPCQASIHRFDMEWPEDCTNLDHMLLGDEGTPTRLAPTPRAVALYQLDADR